MGEMYLSQGVPILQELALMLMRAASTTKLVKWWLIDSLQHKLGQELKARGHRFVKRLPPLPVTDASRVSFFVAFGVSIAQQLSVEAKLRSHVVDFSAPITEILTEPGLLPEHTEHLVGWTDAYIC
jgi:hypothetical protein